MLRFAMRTARAVACAALLAACSRPSAPSGQPVGQPAPVAAPAAASGAPVVRCGDGRPMTVRFYDVGQALAVLVELPDGRHVLVDAGDEPQRPGCGDACATASAHLLSSLRRDLRGAPIDLLWLTHPHSDHIGGAPEVIASLPVLAVADDGRDLAKAEVRRVRGAAEQRRIPVRAVEPGSSTPPLASSEAVKLTPVVPAAWPASCAHDANECSIGLRVDYCRSSVLLVGDAEHEEEKMLEAGGPVTLLQVGHHGSETSTSPAFLARVRPAYAVISAGKPGEGVNRDYCHPRALVVQRLTRVLGGAGSRSLIAFDGERCDRATPADWVEVPASDRLWATGRDGDVSLVTTGDGVFRRESQ